MNVPAYLDRIRYEGPLTPSAEVLRSLHRAHMFAVPFENLDISLGREIVCDEGRFLNKIVTERRGGFCYEMNGAFAALLRALGFKVSLLSARVSGDDGSDGPEFDHLALWVELEQEQFGRRYRLTSADSGLCLEANADGAWKKQYGFTLQARKLAEFAAMCHYHQTSPNSPFTRKRVCSLATPEGRITVTGDKLIETRRGVREERALTEDERVVILRERFGVSLPR